MKTFGSLPVYYVAGPSETKECSVGETPNQVRNRAEKRDGARPQEVGILRLMLWWQRRVVRAWTRRGRVF